MRQCETHRNSNIGTLRFGHNDTRCSAYTCTRVLVIYSPQVRNNIPISQIQAVERVDKHAFSRPTVGQVVTRNSQGHKEIIYFQAKVGDCYFYRYQS